MDHGVALPARPRVAGSGDLVAGYVLDNRYELLRPVARGGMAVVWLARVKGKLGFEKLVAVKTILPHLAKDESFRTMFLDEARIASRIRHPNVASMEDLGEEDGTLYMVLEWIHGDSLARLFDAAKKANRPVSLDVLLRVLADACAGLHSAHELRGEDGRPLHVVHRDVSPQNLLVTSAGVTKVIDFGIAKALDRVAETTRVGLLKGKVEYSAPEAVRMKACDRRVDVWALGVILYQFLAGRLPFEGRDDYALLQAIASGQPPPPLPPSVPESVAQVAMTALKPRRDERYATALDMQRALEACISAPTTASDVAACLTENLGGRFEARRVEIADALAEADRRAGVPPRPRLGSLPELSPLAEGPAAPPPLDPLTELSRTVQGPEPPLRPIHLFAMAFAVVITIAVWGAIFLVLLGPPPHR
jgi:serine/threonine-protein kinase